MPVLMCPHCGSSITAPGDETTQVRCPVCGAMLGPVSSAPANSVREAIVRDSEDDSATRAIAREQVAPHLAPVEADYRSVPSVSSVTAVSPGREVAPDAYDDGVTHISAPTVVRPPAAEDASLHEPTMDLPRSAVPLAPRPNRTLRNLSIVGAVVILVVAVVLAALAANGALGGGTANQTPTATAASTTTPAPTAAPAQQFSIPALYSISYPADWLVHQRNAAPQSYSALFASPSGSAGSMNVVAQQNVSLPAPDALDAQFINALAAPGTAPVLSDPTLVNAIGGQAWTQRTADVTLRAASGQPTHYSHVAALSIVHGSYVYTIVEVAATSSASDASAAFSTADQSTFQPMLASFTFLG